MKQPPSAIPLHLQRSNTVAGSPSRPQSPSLHQRAQSPPVNPPGPAPYRPASPFRSRPASLGPPARTQAQSPGPTTPTTAFAPNVQRLPEDVEVDLVVTSIPRASLALDQPFDISFKLTAQAPVPTARPNEPRRQRIISLVVQHAPPPKQLSVAAAVASAVATSTGPPPRAGAGAWTPRLPSSSGFSTPSPYATPLRGDFHDTLAQRLLVASPRHMHPDEYASSDGGETPGPHSHIAGRVYDLPPPELRSGAESQSQPQSQSQSQSPSQSQSQMPSDGLVFLGTSTHFLPPLRFPVPNPPLPSAAPPGSGHARAVSSSTDSSVESEGDDVPLVPDRLKVAAAQEFALAYVSRRTGFLRIGGLRVMLVEDRLADEDEGAEGGALGLGLPMEPRILREWDVVAEVWVKSE